MNGIFPMLSAIAAARRHVRRHAAARLAADAGGDGGRARCCCWRSCCSIAASPRWRCETRESESAVYQLVQRGMSAIKVVQAFSQGRGGARAPSSRSSRASLRSSLQLYTLQTLFGAGTNLLLAAGTAAVLWLGAHHVWSGALTIGDMIVFISYLASLYAPINALVQTYGTGARRQGRHGARLRGARRRCRRCATAARRSAKRRAGTVAVRDVGVRLPARQRETLRDITSTRSRASASPSSGRPAPARARW